MALTRPKSTTRDMTSGSIIRQIILFSLPLMLGNVFASWWATTWARRRWPPSAPRRWS